MGITIGDINIPFVSGFSVDKADKPIEVIKHLGNIPPHVAEFQADVLKATISGTLFQASGDVRNVDQYAEDLDTLVDRSGVYNYINDYQSRSGWLILSTGDSDKSADSVLIRKYSLSGRFMPKNKYQPRIHTAPVIRSNPWSHVLGTDDCDNYIAIPIGATYSGGDGSTISRTSEDGTITLILATTNNDILFDLAADEVDVGEVKILDNMNEALEADWVRIFNTDHVFTGKIVIQNGLYRIILDPATEYITIYRWNTTVYTKIDDFTCGSFTSTQLTKLNPDQAIAELDSGIEITFRRGHPPLIDTGTDDLLCVTLTPADQSTSTDNYLVLATSTYICSDANFSIVNSTKNLDDGKKWIFFETVSATAEDIAHQALVDSRHNRELITR